RLVRHVEPQIGPDSIGKGCHQLRRGTTTCAETPGDSPLPGVISQLRHIARAGLLIPIIRFHPGHHPKQAERADACEEIWIEYLAPAEKMFLICAKEADITD